MKIRSHKNSGRNQGAVLILTVTLLVFVAFFMATYLLLTENEYASVARSQTWNSAMVEAEAGVEDALALINKNEGNFGQIASWSGTAVSADNWTKNGNVYSMYRMVNTNMGYYNVYITNAISSSNTGPAILSVGAGNWNSSSATFRSQNAVRKIFVQTYLDALFTGAIDTKNNIDLNGNNVMVDSFDSSDPTYSSWNASLGYGTYSSSKDKANGNVSTDSAIVGAISVGQANIYGHVNTGPGGTASVGNNGYVGPLPQSGSGIQPGYSSDDMNVNFSDPVLPTPPGGLWFPVVGNVITNSGYYSVLSISGNLTINASNVVLYVIGNISLSGNNVVNVGTNASATIYVGGPTISTSGNGAINNLTQNAANMAIYGLASVTSISLSGNAAFTGTIYAPEATFSFGGGGSTTYDYVGALVAKSVTLNGHANFHYDESLARNGPARGYIPKIWKEVIGG